MQSWSSEALGQVVRDLRRERGLTQAEFGRRAGYQGGAGVSISRIENGQLEPGPERFEGLAAALDLTTGELAARAAAKSESLGVATGSNSESVMARRERLQQELDSRKELVTDLEQAFAEALDRAKRNFLIRIIEIAGRVYGASPSVPVRLLAGSTPHRDEAEAEAAYLIEFTRYGVEQALAETAGRGAAYETFTEAVARGTLLTIPAISELKGGLAALGGFLAAARVRTPATRGTGTVGGLAILAVSAGGVFLVGQHRSRKQQQQLAAKLDVVEAEIAETEPSIDALRVLMSRATGDPRVRRCARRTCANQVGSPDRGGAT